MSKAKEEPKEVAPKESSPKEVDLNVLIKFIGTFDGSREKLNPFLTNCRNAISLATSAQRAIIFKYILSRLEGRAEAACAIKEFDDWPVLEEFLKTQFGEKKHYTHLLSDLQDCKQGVSETVNQFSLRVETCLAKLLTEINISIPTKKKGELSGRLAAMEDLALHTFTTGLNTNLSTIIRCRNPESLNEAINFAVAEEKILNKTSQGHRHSLSDRKHPTANSSSTARFSFDNYHKPSTSRDVTKPNISKPYPPKLLVTKSEWPKKPFIPNQSKPVQTNRQEPFCRYCKTTGHVLEQCQKREYNNRRFQVNFIQPPNTEEESQCPKNLEDEQSPDSDVDLNV